MPGPPFVPHFFFWPFWGEPSGGPCFSSWRKGEDPYLIVEYKQDLEPEHANNNSQLQNVLGCARLSNSGCLDSEEEFHVSIALMLTNF